MYCYMTNGTENFLQSIIDKHPDIHFFLMAGSGSALLYYEGQDENIFESGRAYESILSSGEMQTDGHVVMNHIPVAEEGQSVFEERFRARGKKVEQAPGFYAFRLLKPLHGTTYIALTQWRSKEAFNDWKESSDFKKAHQSGTRPPAYYADRPFAMTYQMVDIK